MILATDVYYYNDKAEAAGVLFNNREDEKAAQTIATCIDKVEDYESDRAKSKRNSF
jgi:hypothetical protein